MNRHSTELRSECLVRLAFLRYFLSIGAQLFQIPTVVTMAIAATRMHRSLVDFATSNVCDILYVSFLWLIMADCVF
jgi:hypothetical protein